MNIHTIRRKMYFRDKISAIDDHSEMLDMDKLRALGMSHETTSTSTKKDGRRIIKVSSPIFRINGKEIPDITNYRDLVEYHFHNIYMKKIKEDL